LKVERSEIVQLSFTALGRLKKNVIDFEGSVASTLTGVVHRPRAALKNVIDFEGSVTSTSTGVIDRLIGGFAQG
jgi:hypothetical protein